MVLLLLEAGGARYAVPAASIGEVLPVPALRPLPGTPAWIAGAFSYHGEVVPVLDLSALLTGRPAPALLSTRILLLNLQVAGRKRPLLLGLLAEHATETVSCAPQELQPAGVHGVDAPYAGDILVRGPVLVQLLDVERLLAPELRERLFAEAAQLV